MGDTGDVKVYVVSQGECEDWDVERVFATRALAEAYIDRERGRVRVWGKPETYPLNDEIDEWDVLDALPETGQ